MAKIRIVGDSSGYVELAAPNAAGNNTLELPSNATKLVGADASNSLNVTGIATFSSGIVVSAGSTAAPSISPTGDSNTGIFFPSADTVCIGEGGTEALRVDSSGRLGLNSNLSGAATYNRLVVNSPDASCWISLQSANTGSTINSDGIDIGLNGSNQGHFWLRENADLLIATNNTERVRINAGGHVGILSTLSIGTNTQVTSSTGLNPVITVGSATTSRLVWGTPGSNDYRLNLSGGGALVFGVDGDSENFGIEGHQSGVQHVRYLTIDNYGRMTLPYQPSFFAYVTGGDTTTANDTIIVFGATAHNTGGHYSTSTGRFTAPVTGVYAFHAQIWAKNGTGFSRTIFRVAGSQVTQNGFHPGTVSNSNDHSFQMSMVRYVTAGDAVDVMVNLGPLTYYGGGAQSHTYFCGHLVG